MKLIEGKKYNILGENAYYAGKCDSFCGQKCDCCGMELESGYLFHIPVSETTTYEETENGNCRVGTDFAITKIQVNLTFL